MHKTIGLLHCEQISTQYLRANQTRVKQKLTLLLKKFIINISSQLYQRLQTFDTHNR